MRFLIAINYSLPINCVRQVIASLAQEEPSMIRMLRVLFALCLLMFVVFGPRINVHATGIYTIVDLGDLGDVGTFANAINSQGTVVGEAHCPNVCTHAFLYDGTIHDLGTLGNTGTISIAFGINDNGQVTGFSDSGNFLFHDHPFLINNGSMIDIVGSGLGGRGGAVNAGGEVTGSLLVTGNHNHAFLYSQGVTSDLGTLPNLTESVGVGINSSGQVAGRAYVVTSNGAIRQEHAFLFSNRIMIDLTQQFGGQGSTLPGAINDLGQVTFGSYTASGAEHAAVYDSNTGATKDLGTLYADGTGDSYGFVINAAGQVAGWATSPIDGNFHAFFYDKGTMKDIGTVGGSGSEPLAMNSSGAVVGDSYIAGDNETHAYLYSNGMLTDLNSVIPANSGWTLEVATAINDKGQITGYGQVNGQTHSFLLTPSAPASLAPTITKAFGAASISLGSTATLTFTLQNPNATTALSGVGFDDPFPAGIVVSNPNGLTGACGGSVQAAPSSSLVKLTGGTLAANATCTFSVTVVGNSVGSWTNVTGKVSSNESGAGGIASAPLTVGPSLPNCQGTIAVGLAIPTVV
jgi:probable HAF family extracellular repeat protein